MKRIVLIFGILSGTILLGIMLPFSLSGATDFDNAELIGYTSMFFAFLLVFFGIRSYRENEAGGTITFGKAVQVGTLITLLACAMFVVAWEIYHFNFAPDFFEKYAAHVIEKQQVAGASAAEIAITRKKMSDFGKLYANPFFNVGITFMEVFPIGLIVTLISAAILRRNAPANSEAVKSAA